MGACVNGYNDVMMELMKHVSMQDAAGLTSLMIACVNGHNDVMVELMKANF